MSSKCFCTWYLATVCSSDESRPYVDSRHCIATKIRTLAMKVTPRVKKLNNSSIQTYNTFTQIITFPSNLKYI